MENLAVNSAKSSYLSPSEKHQLRKESSFNDVLSVLKYISHVSMPPFLTLYPVWAQKGNEFAERRGQCICIVEEILIVQETPHATGQINWH